MQFCIKTIRNNFRSVKKKIVVLKFTDSVAFSNCIGNDKHVGPVDKNPLIFFIVNIFLRSFKSILNLNYLMLTTECYYFFLYFTYS